MGLRSLLRNWQLNAVLRAANIARVDRGRLQPWAMHHLLFLDLMSSSFVAEAATSSAFAPLAQPMLRRVRVAKFHPALRI
jgi:hypothetical protein